MHEESAPAVVAADRCAQVSLDAGEQTAGTASRWRACLMVEEDGPWGPKVLTDSRLPEAVRAHLAHEELRVLLIRRHGRRPAGDGPRGVRVMASWSDLDGSWAEETVLDSVEDLLDVDLAPLVAGRSLGWEPVADPVVLVCTHGRRDVCCAERGRPVAAALAAQDPDAVWECSHVGGHRFAANVVVLPEGLAYGRVDPGEAVDLLARWRGGQLGPERLRGWVWQESAVQAAEVVLRQRLGLTGRADVRAQAAPADDAEPDVTPVRVEVTAGAYAGMHTVAVRQAPVPAPAGAGLDHADGARVLASCGDTETTAATGWHVGPLTAE